MKKKLKPTGVESLVEWLDAAAIAATELRISSKPLETLVLSPAGRELLAMLDGVPRGLKKLLANPNATMTIAEALALGHAIARAVPNSDPGRRTALLWLCKSVVDSVQAEIVAKSEPTKKARPRKRRPTKTLYQFKITLMDSKPPIWRRIQVMDCTLDKLHEHIQTAMGWTNSHLHQFDIKGERFGDPDLLEDDTFDEMNDFEDSTRTILSQILPTDGKRFRFQYEYDFGDGWLHEILFEGCPKTEKGQKYPLCVEGSLACPPEDVGGMGGYYNYLDAISNPKHEEHESYLEWRGPFDPEAFDPAEATQMMREGLPDWREQEL